MRRKLSAKQQEELVEKWNEEADRILQERLHAENGVSPRILASTGEITIHEATGKQSI